MGITALVFSKIPALLAMSGKDIALLVVCGLAITFLIALVAVSFRLNIIRKRAEAEEKHADKVKIVKGVRYSEDDAIADGEGMNVTHAPGDFILVRGETYRAEKGGKLLKKEFPSLYIFLKISKLTREECRSECVCLHEFHTFPNFRQAYLIDC